MEAIILAGGFGTRLSHIVSDVPKPMAPVNGKPFLTYVLDELNESNITNIVMAVGYMHEKISEYFGESYKKCAIRYSVEDKPLLTGGAIKKALSECHDEDICIVNGDTFFDVDMTEMMKIHLENHSDLTIAVKDMRNFDRYGTVKIDKDRIIGFDEKRPMKQGLINGGVYIIKRNLLDNMAQDTFSFERDVMEKGVQVLNIYAFKSDGYFIDIGVEEDYKKAQIDFIDR